MGNVAITARGRDRLEKTASEIGAFPINADAANEDDIKKTYDEFFKKFNKLDCLINNAGIGGGDEIDNLTLDIFQKVYSVNIFGAAMMAKYAAIHFKERNYGNIVNIGSTAGTKGYPGGTVYSSSKFALKGMTQCWQAELRKFNIRVMLINPSEVTTSFGGAKRDDQPNKLRGEEIAHSIAAALEMDDRGFIPELTVWATNPW